MVTTLIVIMIVTANCDQQQVKSDIKNLCECIEKCEERRIIIDDAYKQCINEKVADFVASVNSCPRGKFEIFNNCFLQKLGNFQDDLSECTLEWREAKAEIDACKEECKR